MDERSTKRKRIGQVFTQLRTILGVDRSVLIERAEGALVRGELHKVERGQSLLSTVPKREALAKAYGVDIAVINALIDGTMSPEAAAKVARMVAKSGSASVASPVGPPSAALQGEAMATFVRLDHVRKSPFPGLEVCILYHEMDGATPWSDSTLQAARAGAFGNTDMPPGKWKGLLDRLEDVLRKFNAPPAEPPTPSKE